MNDLFLYFLKSGIAMALFYLVYHFFMQRETHYSVNRFYLLGTIMLSLIVPLITLESLFPASEKVPSLFLSLDEVKRGVSMPDPGGYGMDVVTLLRWIYLGGVVVLFGCLLFEFIRILLLRKVHQVPYGPMRIIFVNKEIIPFSWFNLIFMDHSSREDPQINTVLHHEYAHYRNKHFIDLLLMELIVIFQWFNPLVWLYARSVKEIHEYQADAAVLQGGKDAGSYQAMLVNRLTGAEVFRLTNALSQSLTKKRMIMMTKMKSKKSAWLKVFLALPVLAALLLLFAGKSAGIPSDEPVLVSGRVVEAGTGKPLEGVFVIIKGITTTGTITDKNGDFTIEVKDREATLMFACSGYKTVESPAGSESMLIKLEKTSAGQLPTELEIKTPPLPPPPPPPGGDQDEMQESQVRIIGERSGIDMSKVLYIIDGVPQEGDDPLSGLDQETITSIQILKNREELRNYTDGDYKGVVIVITKPVRE